MFKYILIWSLLILTSCDLLNNSLENCADASYPSITNKWKENNDIDGWYNYCTNLRYSSEYLKWSQYSLIAEHVPSVAEYNLNGCKAETWEQYLSEISKINIFLNSKLQDKMKNTIYEHRFKSCETNRKVSPSAFKAKWK
tara:strand:+ start:526 stop:945 length:420 start_codon:yes stop_codon:yes gene_type:complete